MPKNKTSVLVVMLTFEPEYEKNEKLEQNYRETILSWLPIDHDVDFQGMVIADFKSNDLFKSFLRGISDEFDEIEFLDGDESLPSFVALNRVFGAYEPDIFMYVASDTRPRNPDWLAHIVSDFESDDSVMAVIPTVTLDGAACLPQTQQAVVNMDSQAIELPRCFQMVTAAFHRKLFVPFGNRIADRFRDSGNEKGVMWQIEALSGKALLNFRCNVIHERGIEIGRYHWMDEDHWSRSLRNEEIEASRAIGSFLPCAFGWGRYQESFFQGVLSAVKKVSPRELAKFLYIYWLKSMPRHAYRQIRNARYHDYVMENLLIKRQLKSFHQLDRSTRVNLVQALFFQDNDQIERQKNEA